MTSKTKTITFWKNQGESGYENEQILLRSNLSHEEVGGKLNRTAMAIQVKRGKLRANHISIPRQKRSRKEGSSVVATSGAIRQSDKKGLKFIVNGTDIEIGKGVKNVMIGTGVIEVNF